MPLYEYGCPQCGATTDVRHGFNESPALACERCGAALVRRFSAAPILFKGSGFYVTDSRAKSVKSESAKTDSSTADSTKTEPATPDAPKTETAKADTAKTEATKTETTRTGTTKKESAA